MEEKEQNNLPIKVKEKSLLRENINLAKATDFLRHTGKIIGLGAISFAGLMYSSNILRFWCFFRRYN